MAPRCMNPRSGRGRLGSASMTIGEDEERRFMSIWIGYRRNPDTIHSHDLPPPRMIFYPDILEKSWGWERLMPYKGGYWSKYLEYLKEYHMHNNMDYVARAADGKSKPEDWPLLLKARPVDGFTKCSQNGKDSLSAASKLCLDMERELMSDWKNTDFDVVKDLSQKIQECATSIIKEGPEYSERVIASLVCITNEAALVCELLRHGAKATDTEIRLCNSIRHCALNFMYLEKPESLAATATLVGVAKEARMICLWMRKRNELYLFGTYRVHHKLGYCDIIRLGTLSAMKKILSKYARDLTFVNVDYTIKKNKTEKLAEASEQQKTHESSLNECPAGNFECQESTVETRRNNIAAELKSNIVNQADMLTSACVSYTLKEPALLDERSLPPCTLR